MVVCYWLSGESGAQGDRGWEREIFGIRLSLADEEGVMFSTKGYAAHSAHEPFEAVLIQPARADAD
jgi:hypothetical protein